MGLEPPYALWPRPEPEPESRWRVSSGGGKWQIDVAEVCRLGQQKWQGEEVVGDMTRGDSIYSSDSNPEPTSEPELEPWQPLLPPHLVFESNIISCPPPTTHIQVKK